MYAYMFVIYFACVHALMPVRTCVG